MSFVLICLLVIFPLVSGNCNGVCWFAFDNRDGSKDAENIMWSKSDGTQPTGLITISGSFVSGSTQTSDTLRFQNYGESSANYEPLIFQHEFASGGNTLNVYGSKNGISDQYEQTISGTASSGDFLIKFSSLPTDKIFIEYSDANKDKAALIFTYNDNWSSWGPLSATPYFNTNRIFSQLRRTKYKYVHICKAEQPTMCDVTLEPVTVLDTELKLNCTAVGPATLSVEWTANKNTAAVSTVLQTKVDETRDIGTVIESTLTIAKFTLDHVAEYTCKVKSSNNLETTQVFTLSYSREIQVNALSEQNFYLSSTKDASFSFKVTGWPLSEVSVITHYDKKEGGDVIDNNTEKSGTGNEIEKRNAGDTLFTLTRTEEYSAVPPSVTFKIQFLKEIPGDEFLFYFIDNTGGQNKTVSTYTVYKVGAKCAVGEYGVGTECKSCAADETSPAKSDDQSDCVKATSNCKAGFYGINDDCTKCPDGKTSNDNALNLNSCFDDPDAQKNTGEEKSNLGGIIGGAVGGAIFLLMILALLYFCVLKKPRTTKSTSTVTMSANTGAEPRKISGGATVTVNPTAGEVDVEKQNKVEDKSEDEDPNGLYDNRNLRSSRYKRRNKERAEQKNSNFDQHIDDIDSGIKALDDLQIEDAEPAYVELDKDHYKKMKEEKEEKRRTLGYPSERKRPEPAEPQEHTYAEAQDVGLRRQPTNKDENK